MTKKAKKHPNRTRRGAVGFSLIELLIAMAVVLVLVGGLAIAGERSLQASRETSAAQTVQSFTANETTYQRDWGGYSTAAAFMGSSGAIAACGADNEIGQTPTLLAPWDGGTEVLGGYTLKYVSNATTFNGSGNPACVVAPSYEITAVAVDGKTKSFCADSNGVFYLPPATAPAETGVGCLIDNPNALPIGQ